MSKRLARAITVHGRVCGPRGMFKATSRCKPLPPSVWVWVDGAWRAKDGSSLGSGGSVPGVMALISKAQANPATLAGLR